MNRLSDIPNSFLVLVCFSRYSEVAEVASETTLRSILYDEPNGRDPVWRRNGVDGYFRFNEQLLELSGHELENLQKKINETWGQWSDNEERYHSEADDAFELLSLVPFNVLAGVRDPQELERIFNNKMPTWMTAEVLCAKAKLAKTSTSSSSPSETPSSKPVWLL